jgi:hypothetical protein
LYQQENARNIKSMQIALIFVVSGHHSGVATPKHVTNTVVVVVAVLLLLTWLL